MHCGNSILREHLIMQLRAIALMLCKLVLRILPIQLIQAAVTANFCKNRSRRDRCGFGIALDKRAFGDRQTRRAVAVDQREIRPPMQTVNARRMARKVACKILISSISRSVAIAME